MTSDSGPRRPFAEVQINGRGPFRFLFDSAATTSAVAGSVLARLGLAAHHDAAMAVSGTLGRRSQPSVHIERLQFGPAEHENLDLPLLDRHAIPDGDGILGISGLRNFAVGIDMTSMTASIDSAVRPFALSPQAFLALLAHPSGLLLVRLRIGGAACTAIVDTGAQRSIGNDALRQVLQPGGRVSAAAPIGDANGVSRGTLKLSVPSFQLGSVRAPDGDMLFTAAAVFETLGLAQEPALLLGMDRLASARRLVLDFPRAGVWIS